jgi:hypothetical protein
MVDMETTFARSHAQVICANCGCRGPRIGYRNKTEQDMTTLAWKGWYKICGKDFPVIRCIDDELCCEFGRLFKQPATEEGAIELGNQLRLNGATNWWHLSGTMEFKEAMQRGRVDALIA